ncbi:9396_t:CDS:2 [Gigaspora margarita]|uniref:9396_t:CDS:1 n=1 Tax=Gigaspora margarita TaxID=4874 RepID=A0ABM8VWI7_GIGMA|nr:9396_t:CDS:2 [Gigaspora margarita]
MPSKKYYTYSEKEKIYAIQEIKDSIIALERDTASFSETSEFSSPEEIIEEIVVTKKDQANYSFKMATELTGLEDIIDSTSKNIKKVFQNGIKPEDKQEAYIIGLKLTLDRLARELEFAQNNYQGISANQIN